MNMSFWSHCQGLVRRIEQRRLALPRLSTHLSTGAETLEARVLLSSTPAMVADINLGSDSSNPENLVAVGSTTFFTASDSTHGQELWKSDGTAAGTMLVKDIAPGSAASNISQMTNVNGTLFFRVDDGTHGSELWKSDGTVAGTTIVKDINAGSGSSSPYSFTNLNGTLLFTANDGTHGTQVWKSDGTAPGTVMLTTTISPNAWSVANGLTNVNGTVFFTVDDGTHGDELWKTNGTVAGTVLVKDIDAGSDSSWPNDLTDVNGTLFFTANSRSGANAGQQLWKSDGTAGGTILLADIKPGAIGHLTNVNGTLFFTASDATNGQGLWKSNGTPAGTVMVRNIENGGDFANVNGTLFFAASDPTNGRELWKSDGTAAGTTLVKDIFSGMWTSQYYRYYNDVPYGPFTISGPNSSSPAHLTSVNGMLFFVASDGTAGPELWQSDGTAAGTLLVADIRPGNTGSNAANLTNINGALFFSADDAVRGAELWALVTTAPPATTSRLSVTGFPATMIAGTAGAFTVTAMNVDGTTNTGYLGKVHFTSTDPQALLPADYIFTPADHGTHTFTATLKTAGSQSIAAADAQSPSVAGVDADILVKAAAVDHMTVSGFPTSTNAGATGSITVTIRDIYGNIADSYGGIVHFTSSDPKAVLPADYRYTTADAGQHTFSVILKSAGKQSITVAGAIRVTLTETQSAITVNAGAVSQLLLSAPASIKAGTAFNLTLTVTDAFGNVITGYTGKVRMTSTDSSAHLPADFSFTAADKGAHTFTGLVLRKRGNQKITITDKANSSLTGSVITNVK